MYLRVSGQCFLAISFNISTFRYPVKALLFVLLSSATFVNLNFSQPARKSTLKHRLETHGEILKHVSLHIIAQQNAKLSHLHPSFTTHRAVWF